MMSRVNRFPEGHGPAPESWTTPTDKKRKRRVPAKRRYCIGCDKWVPAKQTVCHACGAYTERAL